MSGNHRASQSLSKRMRTLRAGYPILGSSGFLLALGGATATVGVMTVVVTSDPGVTQNLETSSPLGIADRADSGSGAAKNRPADGQGATDQQTETGGHGLTRGGSLTGPKAHPDVAAPSAHPSTGTDSSGVRNHAGTPATSTANGGSSDTNHAGLDEPLGLRDRAAGLVAMPPLPRVGQPAASDNGASVRDAAPVPTDKDPATTVAAQGGSLGGDSSGTARPSDTTPPTGDTAAPSTTSERPGASTAEEPATISVTPAVHHRGHPGGRDASPGIAAPTFAVPAAATPAPTAPDLPVSHPADPVKPTVATPADSGATDTAPAGQNAPAKPVSDPTGATTGASAASSGDAAQPDPAQAVSDTVSGAADTAAQSVAAAVATASATLAASVQPAGADAGNGGTESKPTIPSAAPESGPHDGGSSDSKNAPDVDTSVDPGVASAGASTGDIPGEAAARYAANASLSAH